jgi:hypothetical protein
MNSLLACDVLQFFFVVVGKLLEAETKLKLAYIIFFNLGFLENLG